MSTVTWSYVPQTVLAEMLTADVRDATPSPLVRVAGRAVDQVMRRWTLQYDIMTLSDANSMAAFYRTQAGAFQPFNWVNPNDQTSYQVRFGGTLRAELFQPTFFRLGAAIEFVQVTS